MGTKETNKLSLYIHIPFCVKKCNYCDFLSYAAAEEEREAYVQALLREIGSYKDSELAEREVISVFMGGGTPSVLTERQIERVCNEVKTTFNNCDACEFSIEINPGTVTESKCKVYHNLGINRISIGLQSVQDEELKLLGRIHNYEQFLHSYDLVRNAGISNINIDLMSALPGQSAASYCDGLEKIVALKPEHISAYSLIIEEGTPFYDMYYNRRDLLPDEATDRLMYSYTKELLMNFGYNRYEISNYALPGYECIHNQVYWKRGEYLGLGLGSSSYVNHIRFRNTEKMKEYLESCKLYGKKYEVLSAALHKDKQVLSREEEMEEFMFLGLRRMEGVSLRDFEKQFGTGMEQIYGTVIDKYVQSGFLVKYEKNYEKRKGEETPEWYLALTDKGIDVSNSIFEDFLLS